MFSKASKFVHYVLPGVMRPLRVLWIESIGLIFLCLAVPALSSAVKAWRQFDGDDGSSVMKLVVTSIFGLIMIYFGVTSFLRARKISRS
jgi:hypothetical protein